MPVVRAADGVKVAVLLPGEYVTVPVTLPLVLDSVKVLVVSVVALIDSEKVAVTTEFKLTPVAPLAGVVA